MHPLPASLAVVAVGAGLLWQATDGGRALTTETARRLEALRAAPAVPNVQLQSMTGATQKLAGDGRVRLVEFIYTSCPTICQVAGSEMARLAADIRAAGLADKVKLISLSFDPRNDDPPALMAYGKAHGADGTLWSVARPADSDSLPALLDAFGVVVIEDGWGGYVHNTAIHVVDGQGRLRAILDDDDVAGALAAAQAVLP
ncbi:SCO family protein [Afifella pfennigii]|uniref:SCO family protein n=1 Tax=Afifella pfennigii TaxID=209897 RepID=UPI000479F01D|nr:SCO family protein [Afifella pfennigii]